MRRAKPQAAREAPCSWKTRAGRSYRCGPWISFSIATQAQA
jgi:hypothetical protein